MTMTQLQAREKALIAAQHLTNRPQVQLSYHSIMLKTPPMLGGRALTIGDKVYYGGGVHYKNDGTCTDDENLCTVYCYSLERNGWSTLPELPVHVCNFSLGVVKGELVVVGGYNPLDFSKSIAVYTLALSKAWKKLIPSMPTQRCTPAVISFSTHLVVAGDTNAVEIYNVHTSQWSEADKLPHTCNDRFGTICDDRVYLIGGKDCNDHPVNTMYAVQVDKLIESNRHDEGNTEPV